MLFKFEKYKFFGCLLAILFFLSILTTGMRAVYIATLFGLIIWMVYRFNFKNILKLIVCFFLACFIYYLKSDPMNILFFNTDIKINPRFKLRLKVKNTKRKIKPPRAKTPAGIINRLTSSDNVHRILLK
jgi:hypothetical protein